MHINFIEEIRSLLSHSPDEHDLRFLLADHLMEFGFLEEAENEFRNVLLKNDHPLSKAGIARVYFLKESYSNCKQELEALMALGFIDVNILVLYARCLLRQNQIIDACHQYKKVVLQHPLFKDDELDQIRMVCM